MGLMWNQCNWPTQTQCVDGPVSMLSPSLSMTLKPETCKYWKDYIKLESGQQERGAANVDFNYFQST